MGDVFFHLDRLGKVDEDTTFKLNLSNAHPSHAVQELSNSGIFEQIGHEEYDFIEEYFGEGLTAHGMTYLYPNFRLSREALTRFQRQLSLESVVEILSQTQAPEIGIPRLFSNWSAGQTMTTTSHGFNRCSGLTA